MAQLTDQYLAASSKCEHNLELAGEYLLMAAMLMEVNRMLLPPRKPIRVKRWKTRAPAGAAFARIRTHEAGSATAGRPSTGRT